LPAAVCHLLAAGALPFPATGLVAATACQTAVGDPQALLEAAWWLTHWEGEDVERLPAGPVSFSYAPRDANGVIDLGRRPDVCAVSWLFVGGEREATLVLGTGLNPRLWLNGRPVHDGGPDTSATADQPSVKVPLGDGGNTLVARRVGQSQSGFLGIRLGSLAAQP
jgi:hypothetical protein